MRRQFWHDVFGFGIAAASTAIPLLALTWFGDNLSKDGPVGGIIYLPTIVLSLFSAVFVSTAAAVCFRNVGNRYLCCWLGGVAMSLLQMMGAILYWGDWWAKYAAQYRA